MSGERKRKFGTARCLSDVELTDLIMEYNQSSLASTLPGHEKSIENSDDKVYGSDKVFSDPVHGHYELPVLLVKIIDTPQFQRLRYIHQLGSRYFVYMSACHTRFEHSLGVAYLAGKLCKRLQKRQRELGITNKDVLCLQIAGLCHDLGHGPFSHFFDDLFIPTANPGIEWTHEEASVAMFNHMLEANELDCELMNNGLNEQDFIFIRELIAGPTGDASSPEWPYNGRSREKSFLYQIVSNKTSGNDVDKWDYLARDCFHLGIPNSFNYKRYLKYARVIPCDGGLLQICTRAKEVDTLYEMFRMRQHLQRTAFHHKTGLIVDLMLCDVLLKADDHILIPGRDGEMLKISDCINDMHAYTKLTDNILVLIQTSQDQRLIEAQELLQRLHKRDLYKLIAEHILPYKARKCETEWRDEIYNGMENVVAVKEDFIVSVTEFNYGMRNHNPMEHMRFYEKNNPNIGVQIKQNQISFMLPNVFCEQHIRFYSKKDDEFLLQYAATAFKCWYDSKFCTNASSMDY